MKKFSFLLTLFTVMALVVSCNDFSDKSLSPENQDEIVSSVSASLEKNGSPNTLLGQHPYHLLSPANGTFVEPSGVTLKWEKYTGPDQGYTFCHYRVLVNGSERGNRITDQNHTERPISGLSRNQSYTWYIDANYRGGSCGNCYCGEYSEETWTIKVRPAKPSLQATTYGGHPKLTWSAISGADHYKIIKYKDSSSTTTTTTSTSYIDWSENATPSTLGDIMYKVITVNGQGWESLPGIKFYSSSGGWF